LTRGLSAVLLVSLATAIWMLGPGGATPTYAEPTIAARTGYSCGQCHVNRFGGGLRTSFGSLYAQTILSARPLRVRGEGRSLLLPANPDARFAYGGDLRVAYSALSSDDFEDTSTFEIRPSGLYGMARLFPQRLEFYADLQVGSGSVSARELFGLWSFRTGNGYVKVGRFIPHYGWALPDDDSFIRQPLGFSFAARETGIAFGFEPGRWSVHTALVNGTGGAVDDDRSKKVTFQTERRFRRGRIGLSAATDGSEGGTDWGGLYGSVSFGRFSVLAEYDGRRRKPEDDPTVETRAAFAELDVLIKRGLLMKYVHDWMDPDLDVETDQQTRQSFGFEYYPYPFVHLRFYVRHKEGPERVPGANDDQVDLEVHLYF
jgi:hypothetical protein